MKNEIQLWKDICNRFAQQSYCKSRQVGCVIVHEQKVIGQGYNGAPVGSDCNICPRCNKTGLVPVGVDLESAICAHAEANAIGYCARHGISTRGATLYCTTFCCLECAKLIVAAGIKHVVCFNSYSNSDELVKQILNNASITIEIL